MYTNFQSIVRHYTEKVMFYECYMYISVWSSYGCRLFYYKKQFGSIMVFVSFAVTMTMRTFHLRSLALFSNWFHSCKNDLSNCVINIFHIFSLNIFLYLYLFHFITKISPYLSFFPLNFCITKVTVELLIKVFPHHSVNFIMKCYHFVG